VNADEKPAPTLGNLATPAFWAELVVKNGVPAMIAVYLVWSLVSQQQQAIRGLQDSMTTLSAKIDRLSDRLEAVKK
jgi:hypothetical protein